MKRLLLITLFVGAMFHDSFAQNTDTVVIGRQIWMAHNLNVKTFQNGDTIPHAQTEEEWEKAGKEGTPAWCYYDNTNYDVDSVINENSERMYNWYAVNDTRKLTPEGWHIPSHSEWESLITHLGGENTSSAEAEDFLYVGCHGNNFGGTFSQIGHQNGWWSSTEFDDGYAWYRFAPDIVGGFGKDYGLKGLGFSVRCIRN